MRLRLLSLVVLVIAFTSCNESSSPEAPSDNAGKQVGTLLEPRADVTHRKARELVWNKAADQTGLMSYDAVKTGESSSSRIQYSDNTAVNIGEKTLVIVVDRAHRNGKEESVMDLPSGKITGEIKKNPERPVELVVRTRRGWVRANSSTATKFKATVAENGTLQVKTESGQVALVTKDREKTIKTNEEVTILGDPNAATPSPDERFDELPKVPESQWVTKAADNRPKNGFQINEPKNKLTVNASTVRVSGWVRGSYKIFLNGQELKGDSNSDFSKTFDLNPGINILTFQIIDSAQNKVQYDVREVIRK